MRKHRIESNTGLSPGTKDLMSKKYLSTAIFFISLLSLLVSQEAERDEMYAARELLSRELFSEDDPATLRYKEAFLNIKREDFLDSDYRRVAYRNMPIPRSGGVIHPSPAMIANILIESGIQDFSRVMVIGRNSAYLNAILSELTENLFVADPLIRILPEMEYNVKNDLSYFSWVEEGPFNTIILFGSVSEVPQSLVTQLTANGRIILPLEGPNGNQILVKAMNYGNGFSIKSIGESYIHRLSTTD